MLFANPRAPLEMIEGMMAYCARHGHRTLDGVIGGLERGDLIIEERTTT